MKGIRNFPFFLKYIKRGSPLDGIFRVFNRRVKVKKKLSWFYWGLVGIAACWSLSAQAGTTSQENVKVSPTGVLVRTTHVVGTGSDDLAVGDPYGNGPLSASAEAGPKLTQQPYTEGCTESRCVRARKRQLSSPYWKR